MKSAVVVFPGINRETDMMQALEMVTGHRPVSVWHRESTLPKVDLVVVPGGFSYGDYLRCGAIAARSPIMADIRAKSLKGLKVLGVCNGFQIITEAGLLPGALVRNAALRFVCREVKLRVENTATFFTNRMTGGAIVSCPWPMAKATTRATPKPCDGWKAMALWCSAMPKAAIPTAL